MSTILIVDDMPENLRLLRKLLADQDFRVLEASSGEDALKLASSAMPDLFLMDIRLGEGSITGCELAARVRQLPGGRDAILVALSGGAVLEDQAMSRESGFDDFIAKPFDLNELCQRIKGYLARKGASRSR